VTEEEYSKQAQDYLNALKSVVEQTPVIETVGALALVLSSEKSPNELVAELRRVIVRFKSKGHNANFLAGGLEILKGGIVSKIND